MQLKVDFWPEAYPKETVYVEVDTVAHSRGSMAGRFVWTLTMTDTGTHWTELRALWNKGAVGVCGAISQFISEAPFVTRMLNSDNGGECINGHIKRHFSEFLLSVVNTRSRSYRKTENAHVEQKNTVRGRALYGHGRIDDESLIPLMNRINECQGLLKNLLAPTMRLLSKERVAPKYVKRYEKQPKTHAQRMLESPLIPEDKKDAVRSMLGNTISWICERKSTPTSDFLPENWRPPPRGQLRRARGGRFAMACRRVVQLL